MVDNHSCVGDGTNIEGTMARVVIYFLHFWVWPVVMFVVGLILLLLGYDVDAGAFYDGCCGNGYDSCIP